jgi:uncharacterized protein (DUF302 family)
MARFVGLAAAAVALSTMSSLTGAHAMAAEGLITIRSSQTPEVTMNKFEAEVRSRGMMVFAHIDHAAAAHALNLPLRPTEA